MTNKNEKKSPKDISDIKLTNIVDLVCGEGFYMVLERDDILPIENWTENEVYEWFKEMKLDEYLNVIKYKKITGEDIIKGDEKFFVNNLGMEDNEIFKLKYETNKMKSNSICKNMKLWGWGYNKNGQLGQMDYEKDYLKNLAKINLPELKEENDFIVSIKANKDYSVLLSKFGEVYVTGNYSMKKKYEEFLKNNPNDNDNSNQKFKGNNHAMNKKNKKDKKESVLSIKDQVQKCNNKWVNVTKRVCFDSLKENSNEGIRK